MPMPLPRDGNGWESLLYYTYVSEGLAHLRLSTTWGYVDVTDVSAAEGIFVVKACDKHGPEGQVREAYYDVVVDQSATAPDALAAAYKAAHAVDIWRVDGNDGTLPDSSLYSGVHLDDYSPVPDAAGPAHDMSAPAA